MAIRARPFVQSRRQLSTAGAGGPKRDRRKGAQSTIPIGMLVSLDTGEVTMNLQRVRARSSAAETSSKGLTSVRLVLGSV